MRASAHARRVRSARPWLIAANALLALLMYATYDSALGRERWHDDVLLVAVALGGIVAYPLLRKRRVVTLLLASFGAWSTITGVWLVYVTPRLGQGRWMTWWHVATSAAFLLAFLAHWLRNNARLWQLARRLRERTRLTIAFASAWALVGVVAVASLRPPLRETFDDSNFRELSTVAFGLAGVALVYGAILVSSRRWRERFREVATRNRMRGGIDLSLLATVWLVTLTGFPLLYLALPLRHADAYWLLAVWHVITSAMLLALVVAHASLNARPLRSHAR